MKKCRPGLWLVLFLAGAVALARADADPLRFERIDLRDGRILRNVTVRSFDAATDKLLLLADGKAMLIPVALVPAPFDEALRKNAPPLGDTTSIVTTQAQPGSTRPATDWTPPQARPDRPANPRSAAPAGELLSARHRTVAARKAERYFLHEYPAGSTAIAITKRSIDTDQPESVSGWPGRFRTSGRAHLEFYDSKGRSFSRASRDFEVLTEQKPGEEIKVVEFVVK